MKLEDIDYARSTALVTGGSSGIGRAIAFELAARGVRNMVLVARGPEKLAKAASELRQSAPGIDVREISIDLSKHDAPAEVQRQVQAWGWHVDLLVNDAAARPGALACAEGLRARRGRRPHHPKRRGLADRVVLRMPSGTRARAWPHGDVGTSMDGTGRSPDKMAGDVVRALRSFQAAIGAPFTLR